MVEAMTKQQRPRIMVNGTGIGQSEINREAQYHPATSLSEAKKMAARALVIRELLLQEAIAHRLCSDRPAVKDEEGVIARLLKQEVSIPEPDEEICHRYFQNNRQKFRNSPLYEVSHILIMAPPNKKTERIKAWKTAQKLIEELQENPERFEVLAKEYSACTSGKEGGFMGQISEGQTTRNFEKALFKMKKDDISTKPVETRFGYHVIKVHQCAEGKTLDYEMVKDMIADYLTQKSWQHAVRQYIQILAGKADITGIHMESANSPLVQ